MDDSQVSDTGHTIVIHSKHGPLYGQLVFVPQPAGLVLLVQAGGDGMQADTEGLLAAEFRQAGLATLQIDLRTPQEERFADTSNNIPLLAQRLLDCLARLKQQMQNSELPTLAIGLYGAGPASPVIVRVAALRDHDIAALVCYSGLIDLAGVLYLRSLVSPLLMFVDTGDRKLLTVSQRALREVAGTSELATLAMGEEANAGVAIREIVVPRAAQWFARHFREKDRA